jgi:hypothetical protein
VIAYSLDAFVVTGDKSRLTRADFIRLLNFAITNPHGDRIKTVLVVIA